MNEATKEVPLRRRMCEARPAEVPPLVNRPKALGGPQPSGWHQPKARWSKRVALIGAGRRLNVWRLLRGLSSSYTKAPIALEWADVTLRDDPRAPWTGRARFRWRTLTWLLGSCVPRLATS
jgi:hypothetical protein